MGAEVDDPSLVTTRIWLISWDLITGTSWLSPEGTIRRQRSELDRNRTSWLWRVPESGALSPPVARGSHTVLFLIRPPLLKRSSSVSPSDNGFLGDGHMSLPFPPLVAPCSPDFFSSPILGILYVCLEF